MFATRLLPNGQPDPSFTDEAVTGVMQRATALAVDSEDAIIVAGHNKTGLSGALVVRLQADGLLDSLFGAAGSLSLEIPSFGDPWLNVHDIEVLPDRGVLRSGGEFREFPPRPFMVRLLGDGAGSGPGVLDVKSPEVPAIERTGQAVVTVRRIGGGAGPVSVAYETQVEPESSPAATPGLDYTAVSGRLQ